MMKRFSLVLLVLLSTLTAPLWAADSISINELKQAMQADKAPIIIDVRDEDEYLAGHIPGAIMVPAKQMDQHLDMLKHGLPNSLTIKPLSLVLRLRPSAISRNRPALL